MPLLRLATRKAISSLVSLSVDAVTKNIQIYTECLLYLPPRIKDKILQKVTRQGKYWRLFSSDLLKKLIQPNLKCIDLSMVYVDDMTLNVLSECCALTEVNVKNCGSQQVTSEGLKRLFEKTPNLIVVDVSHCEKFDDSVLECLSVNCRNLSELNCEACDITDGGLKILAHYNKVIKCLTLSNNIKLTGEGVSEAVRNKNWRYLLELRLDNCKKIDDDVLRLVIENCPKIEILTFYNCAITDETSVFEDIAAKCTNLKQLHWTISW